jgi:hypothetical protein
VSHPSDLAGRIFRDEGRSLLAFCLGATASSARSSPKWPAVHDSFAKVTARRGRLRRLGLALRRWRRQAEAAEFSQSIAATTRWRVSALSSTPLPVPGIGRARWRRELTGCRRGESAEFEVEACDAQGRLALPAPVGPSTDSGQEAQGDWFAVGNLCSSVELATYGRSRKRSLIKMPWTSNDAERHTHKATTPELKELWAKVANESLEQTGDEGRAIREANAVIARQKAPARAADK